MATDYSRLLNFFSEPVLIIATSGRVHQANQAARRLFGSENGEIDLAARVVNGPEAFEAFLRRCAASTSITLQSFEVEGAGGETGKTRFHGARLGETADATPLVVVRTAKGGPAEFSVLASKVRELDAQLRQRLHMQAVLEEAVSDRDTLLRELQHRVKNNMQVILSMIGAARRPGGVTDVDSFLATLHRRTLAMATVQQLMYRSSDFEAIRGDDFIRQLCVEIGKTFDDEADVNIEAPEFALPHDVAAPLALIVNELLTNCYKYGRAEHALAIRVAVERSEQGLVLSVCDNGRGYPPSMSPDGRMSGLGLVRGLCRQIGASVRFENQDGACAFVQLPTTPDQKVLYADDDTAGIAR